MLWRMIPAAMLAGIGTVGQQCVVPGCSPLRVLFVERQLGGDRIERPQQIAAANGQDATGRDPGIGRPGATGTGTFGGIGYGQVRSMSGGERVVERGGGGDALARLANPVGEAGAVMGWKSGGGLDHRFLAAVA